MKNFWGSDAEFSRSHKNWTVKSSKAQNSPYHVLLEKAEFLFLDPQTDDITAKRIDSALQHADKNALHNCLESIRHGREPAPTTDLFEQNSLNGFSEFMFNEIEPGSLPSDEQRSFITAHEAQIVGLQGPPGTGKTDGAFAPALLGRAWERSQRDLALAGLITAPSNTAIDELLDSVAELYADCQPFDSSGALESVELIRIASDKPRNASDCVTYLDYNDPDDDPDLTQLGERLHNTTTGGQGKISDFGESTESSSTQTLVFATPSRAWKLINEVTPGNDAKSVASQSVWHLLAADEASMMTVPQFLLAGASLRSDGQVLVGGDHRQLPPVQKHDWDNERRRSIRSTVPYLSTLDYLRVLQGEEQDVLGENTAKAWDGQRDPTNVEIPFVQLSTTYRFGHTTANLSQAAVYEQDQINYTAANPSNPLPAKAESPSSLRTALSSEAPITLITYSATGSYQQSNPIEEAIAAALINARQPDTSAGVVTPHNAQKSRLQTTIFDSDSINATRDTVQIETVNRFQGGEAKLMVLSGTVADPQYIRKEDDFLLTETRVNVAMTRHKQTLVVIAPQSLLGYIPTDTELYDDATIWKKVADWSGEAPTTDESPVWKDTLQSFVHNQDLLSRVPDVEHETEISVYCLSNIKSGT